MVLSRRLTISESVHVTTGTPPTEFVRQPLKFAVRVCRRESNVTYSGHTRTGRPLGASTSGVTTMLPDAVEDCLPVPPVTLVPVSRAVSSDALIQRYLLLEPGILIVAPRNAVPLLTQGSPAAPVAHVIVGMTCTPPPTKSPAKLPDDCAGAR